MSLTDILTVIVYRTPLPAMIQLCSTCSHLYRVLRNEELVNLYSHKCRLGKCTNFKNLVETYVRNLNNPTISLRILGKSEYTATAIEKNLVGKLEISVDNAVLYIEYAELCHSYGVVIHIAKTWAPYTSSHVLLTRLKYALRVGSAQARALIDKKQYHSIKVMEDAIKCPARRCLKIRSPEYARMTKDDIPDKTYLRSRSNDIYSAYLLGFIDYDELVRLSDEERNRMKMILRQSIVEG